MRAFSSQWLMSNCRFAQVQRRMLSPVETEEMYARIARESEASGIDKQSADPSANYNAARKHVELILKSALTKNNAHIPDVQGWS